MLTPVDIQNKVFKGGIGFDKKDVETFLKDLSSDYEMLYRSNIELKDKITALNESLQHYRTIEDSMQKALTLSEKTAEETINAANDKARQLTTEAEKKAASIVADAKEELWETKNEIFKLKQQHAQFKEQFTKVLDSQLKILNGEMIDIDLGADFEGQYNNGFGNFYGGAFPGGNNFGGLGNGGGYVGGFPDGFERTNQDSFFNRATLNMDPFADAMNGGGRFSRHTGRAFNGSTNNSTKKYTNLSSSNENTAMPYKQDVTVNSNPPTPMPQESVDPDNKTTDISSINNTVHNHTSDSIIPEKEQSVLKDPVKGEVENTAKESTMLDSEDNYSEGFDFVEESQEASRLHSESSAKCSENNNTMSGEVEDTVKQSTMLDSEDNHAEGFDFGSADTMSTTNSDTISTPQNSQKTNDTSDKDNAYSGEVEDKINESAMLDSEDNYDEGFDFSNDDTDTTALADSIPTTAKSQTYSRTPNEDNETYSGEVEDKVNESTMLDSEDNYNNGFDFVVGNEEKEDDIPTIFTNRPSPQTNPSSNPSQAANINLQAAQKGDSNVLEGDVEDNYKKSNLIGNADNDEEGFNFL